MSYDWFGFFLVFVFGFMLTVGPIAGRFPKLVGKLLIAGILMRVVGSIVRYWVLYGYYSGGDAGRYYKAGLYYSSMIWQFDFSFFDAPLWGSGQWWGTQTVMLITGFVMAVIGPTKHGGFLFFSILAFCGLLFFAKAFQKNFPDSSMKGYLGWLLFFPSLCFWPSSLGKDALILLATGLVVYGYTSKGNRIGWLSFILGLGLAGMIRPHVAGVMVVSVAVAHWLSPAKKWGAGHFMQGMLIMILLVLVLRQGFSNLGIEAGDFGELRSYVDTISERTSEGGSAIGTPTGPGAIPLAIVNILFRPFPWEAGSFLAAAASAEMIFFWSAVIAKRRRVWKLIRAWRSNRLLRFVVPLTILYVLMLGMAIGNLGIIARQRIHVMPLLIIWLHAITITRQLKRVEPQTDRILPDPQAIKQIAS
ncbi:hypothetical protein L0222_26020 [bacterium]|nr:hypothetical protein [bacterium]